MQSLFKQNTMYMNEDTLVDFRRHDADLHVAMPTKECMAARARRDQLAFMLGSGVFVLTVKNCKFCHC